MTRVTKRGVGTLLIVASIAIVAYPGRSEARLGQGRSATSPRSRVSDFVFNEVSHRVRHQHSGWTQSNKVVAALKLAGVTTLALTNRHSSKTTISAAVGERILPVHLVIDRAGGLLRELSLQIDSPSYVQQRKAANAR